MAPLAELFVRYQQAHRAIEELRASWQGERAWSDAHHDLVQATNSATAFIRRRGEDADWLEESLAETGGPRREFALAALERMQPPPRRFLVPMLRAFRANPRNRYRLPHPFAMAIRAYGDEARIIDAVLDCCDDILPDTHPTLRVTRDKPGGYWQLRLLWTQPESVVSARVELPATDYLDSEHFRDELSTKLRSGLRRIACPECHGALRPSTERDWVLCRRCGGAFTHRDVLRLARAATA